MPDYSTGANVSVMVLQGYKSTPRKADQSSLAMGDMLCTLPDMLGHKASMWTFCKPGGNV